MNRKDLLQKNPNSGINPEFDELLTIYSNDILKRPITKSEKQFIQKAYNINVIEGKLGAEMISIQ